MTNLSIKKLTNLFKKNRTSNIMREINKAFKQINMTVPNYIKTGYYSEKQLSNLVNRYNKALAETEKVNVRLNKELSKYNEKIDKIEKELDLTELELDYLKGEDIFTGSTRSFFKQGLVLKKISGNGFDMMNLKSKKDMIKMLKGMTKNLNTDKFREELSDDVANDKFNEFLGEEIMSIFNEKEKKTITEAFNNLSTIQKHIFLDGVVQNLVERYPLPEDGEDTDYGDEYKMNVYNSLMHNLMNAERVNLNVK